MWHRQRAIQHTGRDSALNACGVRAVVTAIDARFYSGVVEELLFFLAWRMFVPRFRRAISASVAALFSSCTLYA